VLRKEFGSLLVRARWSSRSRISTVASGIAAASQKRVSRSPPVRSRALNLVFARSLLSTRRSTCQRCCFARTAGRGALLHLGEQQPSCGPISSLLRTTSERASRAPRHCCYARHATVPTGSDFAPAPMGMRHSDSAMSGWPASSQITRKEHRGSNERRGLLAEVIVRAKLFAGDLVTKVGVRGVDFACLREHLLDLAVRDHDCS
jgi:hypothetical protein